MKRAKIVATLGPASNNEVILKAMVIEGVNVVRLNMSHGDHAQHAERVALVRKVAKDLDRPVAILVDLQGPKIRTGNVKDDTPFNIEADQQVRFIYSQNPSEPGLIATTFQPLVASLQVNETVLIDDGKLRLKVTARIDEHTLDCKVIQGGLLQARKGINVPDAPLPIAALTEKDKVDAKFALAQDADYVALSFVRSGQDVAVLKAFMMAEAGRLIPIIAKIEKPQAVRAIDAILDEADGLMVARGDLGLELPAEQVPVTQKQLVDKANRRGKPVIIATQMLETMTTSLQPTRAEVSDVANAVFDMTDALMLSGETAAGQYPVDTVAMMSRIISYAETNRTAPVWMRSREMVCIDNNDPGLYFAQHVASAAAYISTRMPLEAIIVLTHSGSMAQRISKLKPTSRVIALTPDAHVYRRLALLWGVIPILIAFDDTTEATLARGQQHLLQRNLLQPGDHVLVCAGKTKLSGASNMLKLDVMQADFHDNLVV